MFIRDRYSQLNDFEHVDITSHCLIVVVCAGFERAYWACDDSWEFGILSISIVSISFNDS
jgi:hypothetical protein